MPQYCLYASGSIPSLIRYDRLFENLPALCPQLSRRGRPPIGKDVLLKALIYRNLRGMSSLVDLEGELNNNSSMLYTLGLDPLRRAPSDERFSDFLRSSPNIMLQNIHTALVKDLIQEGVITGDTFTFDSCPIEATVKQNNLKTSVKDRYDKTQVPQGDQEARLGVNIHVPSPFQKRIHYFWGYRNHVITDTASELPVVEQTCPANKNEQKVALPLLRQLHQDFQLPIRAVTGDANYDTEAILDYIINHMNAEAVIPRNLRNTQHVPYTLRTGTPYCQAELPMYRKGKTKPRKITYCQYCCPLHWSKQFRGQYLTLPCWTPQVFQPEGLYRYVAPLPWCSYQDQVWNSTVSINI